MALINCWECGKKISDAALVCPGCGAPSAKTPDIPIHKAAEDGNIEAVKQHIAAGTDVNAKDGEGGTPLHDAVRKGHKEIVELLIAEGADVNAMDDNCETPLDCAEGETYDFLRKHGGMMGYYDIHDAAGKGNVEGVKQYLTDGEDVNTQDWQEWTPLHYAAQYGRKEVVELLISNGADVSAKEEGGETPLLLATSDGHKETAELLIEKGADVNAKWEDGWTPLHLVAPYPQSPWPCRGHVVLPDTLHFKKIGELLISKGADVNAMTDSGETPLDFAVKGLEKGEEIIYLLCKHGGKTGEELKAAGK